MKLKAPFPYFGGKSKVAGEIWSRLGDVKAYFEPFFGSGAVLIGRPTPFVGLETANDKDHFISNFWRALKSDPEGLARECDWPINETDLHARHVWLVGEGAERIKKCYDDPDHYDLKVAAWWVWGQSMWIGGGWCSRISNSPPRLTGKQGINSEAMAGKASTQLRPWSRGHRPEFERERERVLQKRPRLAEHKQLGGGGSTLTKRPRLGGYFETGIHASKNLKIIFKALADRFRHVRICCGSWDRIMTTAESADRPCGVFLDPPYTSKAGRQDKLYSQDSLTVGDDVHAWAVKHGDNPLLRIALCGYEGEYELPPTWSKFSWKTGGGYSNRVSSRSKENAAKERIWFSPHCVRPQRQLFDLEVP